MPQSHGDLYFLSNLVERKLFASDRTVLGKLWDLVVDLDLPEPEVRRLVYRTPWSRTLWSLPWSDVQALDRKGVVLKADASPPAPLKTGSLEILLKEFLLDKQIVDTNGAKVERVNDLLFHVSNGKLILSQVDVGLRGLLRRLGWERPIAGFMRWFFDYELKDRFIAWHYVQPLADPDRLRLQISQQRLASLHPADLADIIEDMDIHERAAVVESLEEEVVADALEEMQPQVQVAIIGSLEPDKAADIIEEMSPDEAADLIADLPEKKVQDIFEVMDQGYRDQVKALLVHEEDEAGGLMSTQYMSLTSEKTIVDALAHIKQHAHEVDVVYYIYVVDAEQKLLGVTNLRELLTNEIFTPLERIMSTRLITVRVDDHANHLAELFAKYGFRAIPVVDEQNHIQGVVRFKALLDILAPHLGQ